MHQRNFLEMVAYVEKKFHRHRTKYRFIKKPSYTRLSFSSFVSFNVLLISVPSTAATNTRTRSPVKFLHDVPAG